MFFRNPIDFDDLKNIRFLLILLSGCIVFLFLYIFHPFGLTHFNIEHKPLFISGYGVIVSFMLLISYVIIPFLWKSFFTYKFWNVGTHLIFLVFNLTLVSILNFVYSKLTGYYDYNPVGLIYYIGYTYATALVPSVVVIALIDRHLLKKRLKDAAELHIQEMKENPKLPPSESPFILLKSQKVKDEFLVKTSSIVYCKANDNYVDIYYLDEHKLKKRMMRTTLSQTENSLMEYTQIIRCHRSYIINLDYVTSVEGQYPKISFLISDFSLKIPVSKSIPNDIIGRVLLKSKAK